MSTYVGVAHRTGGTVSGVFRQKTGASQWEHLHGGLPEGIHAQAITVHPVNSNIVFVGAGDGLYRSVDAGDHWERLDVPADLQIWSVLVHPTNPRVVYAGTSPVGVLRSDDGGDTWRKLPNVRQPDRVKMSFPCRVMRLSIDPAHPNHIYAALEVGGAMRSLDGGETWNDCATELVSLAERNPHLRSRLQSDTENEGMLDAHALCVSAAQPDTVFLAVRMGLFKSTDAGATWKDVQVGRFSPLTYARDVRVSPHDPKTLFACLSQAAASQDGSLYRSTDFGETWQRFDRGVKARATMMAVAQDPRDPKAISCVSRCGQVFSTADGGATWAESLLPDGVKDVYAIAR
ncbi:MAG: WD40/YVTN/BNR-like repeat-containing protein [Burkholderiales bacterium]